MSVDQDKILTEIATMLRAVLRDYEPEEEITLETTFRGDLEMESIDVVSLAGRLQARYGSAVNFAQFVAGLDLESVQSLTVGQLVDFVSASLAAAETPAPPAGLNAGSGDATPDPVEAASR